MSSPTPTPEQDELYAKVRDVQDAQHLLATQQVVLGGRPVQRSTFTVVPGTGAFEGETTFFDPRSGEETRAETRGVEGRVWLTFDEWSPPGQGECWLDSTGGLARLGVDPTGPGEVYQDLLASLLDNPANYRSGGGFYAAVDVPSAVFLLPPRAQALVPGAAFRRAADEAVSVFVRSDEDRPGLGVSLGGGSLAMALGVQTGRGGQLAQLLEVLSVEVDLYPGARESLIEPPDPATVVRDPAACLPDDSAR